MGEHGPRTNEPDYTDVLSRNAVVRDVAAGKDVRAESWIEAHMAAERRTREECAEALINAIARGDLLVLESGDQ